MVRSKPSEVREYTKGRTRIQRNVKLFSRLIEVGREFDAVNFNADTRVSEIN